MDSMDLPLRILYTINSSPQYILARSPSSVPVVLLPQALNRSCPDGSTCSTGDQGLPPCYATTFLKTCLDTICRSSPELVQDVARDFSVYVLDPLESSSAPAPVNISNTKFNFCSPLSNPVEPSNGVAVGLGLMSWALGAGETDGVTVTGTLIRQGTGQEALEVIFALRETAAMQKANLAAALKSWGRLPKLTSGQSDIPTSHPLRQSSKQPALTTAPTCPSGLKSSSDLQPCQAIGPLLTIQSSTTSQSVLQSSDPSTSVPFSSANVSASPVPASLRMHSRRKLPKSKKCIKAAFNPSSEADKIMLAEETYIGPRRKKGRPAKGSATAEGSGGRSSSGPEPAHADDDVIILDDAEERGEGVRANSTGRLDQVGISSVSTEISSISAPKKCQLESACPPFVPITLPRPDPNSPTPVKAQGTMTLLDILAYLSASSSSRDPSVQNAALLAALNAIDSTSCVSRSGPSKSSNPVLVNALKDLISVVSKPTSPTLTQESQTSRPHFNSHHRTTSQDDEIVLLDKENVNPTAFRRRTGREVTEKAGAELSASLGASSLGSQQISMPSSAVDFDGTSYNRNLSARLNVQPAVVAPTSPSPAGSNKRRKRTLSDFLDDRDSRMGLVYAKQGVEGRDAHRHGQSVTRRASSMNATTSGLRHYPRLLCDQLQRRDRTGTNSYYRTGTEFWSSPPRSRNEDHSTANGTSEHDAKYSRLNPIDISDSPPSLRVTASSPVRSQSRRKRYVVPAWARTGTSTQPRLSQATQQALGDAGEKEIGKKKGRHRGERAKKRHVKSIAPSCSAPQPDTAAHQADSVASPVPVAPSSDCPVFAITSGESTIPALFTPTAGPRSPGSFVTVSNISGPKTPPRRRTYASGYDNGGSLFTPANRVVNGRDFVESPLFSPRGLFSPLSYKTMNTSSLSGTSLIGDLIDQPKTPTVADREEADESKDADNTLHQELDDALKEIDQPCSSLSDSGSGDIDANEGVFATAGGEPSVYSPSEVSDNRADATINALWAGLPPSSPPPMSSPLLIPDACSDDEDMDNLDLPVATSDAEDWVTDAEAVPSSSAMPDLSTCSDQEFSEYLSSNDFSALLVAMDQPPIIDHEAEFDMDVFNQFTTLGVQSDGAHGRQNSSMDAGLTQFQSGLAEVDFTEFWETFKPLAQSHILGNNNHILPADAPSEFLQNGNTDTPEMMEAFDHTKLAEDVQALLSGCLV